jgi:DNA-binding SARP family transcriptional activator
MALLQLTLLGGFQARIGTGPALTLPTKKAQALLAYLAVPAGRAHPRDKLATLLWGDSPEGAARTSLRQALFALRRALPAGGVRVESDAIALDPAAVDVDVAAFERSVAGGTPAALARAAQRYQGDLLAGLSVEGTGGFEEWLLGERERLRELALEGLAKLLAHQRQAGQTEPAIQTGLQLLGLDPLQEAVHRALMRLYAQAGRRGTALRQYQACVGVLQRELGVEPEVETKALYQAILRERPSRVPAEADPGTEAPGRERERQLPRPATVPVRAASPGARQDMALVGRAGELARLGDALERALGGSGQLVAVLGEAGIGKSRLVAEFAADAAGRGAAVVMGRSYESEQILPFGPWVDALRAAGVAADDDLLHQLGPALSGDLARVLPELATRGGTAETGQPDYRPLFESVARTLGHLAARHPLVLILEDLHWADEMSARLVAFVGRRLDAWRVLVLLTAREEELADTAAVRQALEELEREQRVATLALGPLSREETLALVRALARVGTDEAGLARLGEQVWAASEGNPFVAVETVRAVTEGAAPGGGQELRLPERVREIVGRRLARLSEPARSLAAVAAVVGRDFEFALLQRAGGLGEEEAAAGVEELVRRRVLHGVGERFDFTHDRLRTAIYAGLLSPRRVLLHRRVAETLEVLHAHALDTEAPAVAWHASRGELWDKAVEYLRRAAALAVTRASYHQAAAYLDQALDAHGRQPPGPGSIEEAIDLHLELRHTLWPLDANERILGHLRAAEALADRIGDRLRLGKIAAYRLQLLRQTGDTEAAIATGRQVLRLADESGDAALQVPTRLYLGQALVARGDYDDAEAVLRKNCELRGELARQRYGLPGYPVAFSLTALARCAAERGEFADAVAAGAQAIELADAVDQPFTTVATYPGVALTFLRRGDGARSIDLLERARALSRPKDFEWYARWADASLGYAYHLMGGAAESVPLLEAALRDVAGAGTITLKAMWLTWLGEVHLARGRFEDARTAATRAVDVAEHHRHLGQLAFAHWLLSEVSLAEGASADVVESHLDRALALADPRRMRPLMAHCRLTRGKLGAARGKLEAAAGEIDAARAAYQAMEMPYWRARAEARRAALT